LIRKALKGGSVPPYIASRIMIYTYSTTFSVSPLEAYHTPATLVSQMLEIHGEVKRIESEEFDKAKKRR
jgi:hypothetical protein|tara:strand:- start:12367 stop:12573 length:207 start_codon:yes stop_codon:yes gene_type:complete